MAGSHKSEKAFEIIYLDVDPPVIDSLQKEEVAIPNGQKNHVEFAEVFQWRDSGELSSQLRHKLFYHPSVDQMHYFKHKIKSVIYLQAFFRGFLTRKRLFINFLRNYAASRIQLIYRAWIADHHHHSSPKNGEIKCLSETDEVNLPEMWKWTISHRRIKTKRRMLVVQDSQKDQSSIANAWKHKDQRPRFKGAKSRFISYWQYLKRTSFTETNLKEEFTLPKKYTFIEIMKSRKKLPNPYQEAQEAKRKYLSERKQKVLRIQCPIKAVSKKATPSGNALLPHLHLSSAMKQSEDNLSAEHLECPITPSVKTVYHIESAPDLMISAAYSTDSCAYTDDSNGLNEEQLTTLHISEVTKRFNDEFLTPRGLGQKRFVETNPSSLSVSTISFIHPHHVEKTENEEGKTIRQELEHSLKATDDYFYGDLESTNSRVNSTTFYAGKKFFSYHQEK